MPFGPHSQYSPLCWAHRAYTDGKMYFKRVVSGFSWPGGRGEKSKQQTALEPGTCVPGAVCCLSGVAGIPVQEWWQTVPILQRPHSWRMLSLWLLFGGLSLVCCWRKLPRVSFPQWPLTSGWRWECESPVTLLSVQSSEIQSFRAEAALCATFPETESLAGFFPFLLGSLRSGSASG